jgi:hypothetical protein
MELVYGVVLFLHVLAVVALFIALALELTSMRRMRAAQTVAQLQEWAGATGKLAVVFPMSSITILLSGIYMTLTRWSFMAGWPSVALVMLVVLGVLGGAVNGRRQEAIHASIAQAPIGPVPSSLTTMLNDPVLWTSVHVNVALAVGIVFLMAVKPDLIWSIVAMVVFAALGYLAAQALGRVNVRSAGAIS